MADRSKDRLVQAQRDLEQAKSSQREDRYEWACFAAQQSAEKAAKALHLFLKQEAWGHIVARLLKEHGERAETEEGAVEAWPDLVLIDGGAGQLSAAVSILEDLGIGDLCIAGIAKGPDRDAGREHFYMPGQLFLNLAFEPSL